MALAWAEAATMVAARTAVGDWIQSPGAGWPRPGARPEAGTVARVLRWVAVQVGRVVVGVRAPAVLNRSKAVASQGGSEGALRAADPEHWLGRVSPEYQPAVRRRES